MKTSFTTLRAADGRSFEAFVAQPPNGQGNGKGLVIFPEVYNINAWIQEVAREYANDGYLVIVPDLFWRQEAGVHMDYDQVERARALGFASDTHAIVSDTVATAGFLKQRLGLQAKIGSVGFCIGGRFALLAGAQRLVDAVSAYYGTQLEQYLPQLERLEVPALLHFAENDPWVSEDILQRVGVALADKPRAEIHRYNATGHGFARKGYPPYVQAPALDARVRTLAFFAEELV